MNSDNYIALQKRLRELRREHKRVPSGQVPEGIKLLRKLLKRAVNNDEYIALAGLLLSEYAVFEMYDEQEILIRDEIKRFPNQPIPQITLANFLATVKKDLKGARKAAESAVKKAHEDGNFIRDAYNCRARIAVRAADYELLEDTLHKLIEYNPEPSSANVRLETDFLENIPEGAVDNDLLRTYRKISAGQL